MDVDNGKDSTSINKTKSREYDLGTAEAQVVEILMRL